ncbi:MAG: YbaN family protein [Rhodospirillaceae bacterium]|nr:YbaN family protein [Rhodospirillaceae bacterium]
MSADPEPSVPTPADTAVADGHTAGIVPRWVYRAIGWTCVGLGGVGTVLPLLPTTPFLLIAVWAFARSSPHWADWLRRHRAFGPLLRDWEDGQRIPLWAKIFSSTVMAASLAWMTARADMHWALLAFTALLMSAGAGYVWSRPSRRPAGPG